MKTDCAGKEGTCRGCVPKKVAKEKTELEEKCKNEMNEMPENDSGKKLYAAKNRDVFDSQTGTVCVGISG